MDFIKIKELRTILGLSQSAICAEIGLNLRTWQGYDAKGKAASPGSEAKKKIIEFFYAKIDVMEATISTDEEELEKLEKTYKKLYKTIKQTLLTADISQLEATHSTIIEILKRLRKNRLDLIRYADILNEVHNEN